jgi:hypothetical protein
MNTTLSSSTTAEILRGAPLGGESKRTYFDHFTPVCFKRTFRRGFTTALKPAYTGLAKAGFMNVNIERVSNGRRLHL